MANFLLGIGTVLSAGSSVLSGMAQKTQAEYNARVAEEEGRAIQSAYSANEPIYAEEARALRGEQSAAAASMGVEPGVGAPLLQQINTHYRYLRDRSRRKMEADTGVRQTQSAAAGSRLAGQSAYVGSLLTAGGTLAYGGYKLRKEDNPNG